MTDINGMRKSGLPKSLPQGRTLLIVFLQATIIAFAFFLAFLLRFDWLIPELYFQTLMGLLLPILVLKMIVFWKMGLFRGWWRYVSMADLVVIFKANLYGSLALVLYVVFVQRMVDVPRSILVLDGVFCFLMIAGIRFLTRAFRENYLPMPVGSSFSKIRVVIFGAGDAGQAIVREMRLNSRLERKIIGFLDDDTRKIGLRFQGIKVLGGREDIPKVCGTRSVNEVIIAMPSASGKEIRMIVETCQKAGVAFKIVPGVGDLIDGRVSVKNIRDVCLEDLLGREPVHLDVPQIEAYLKGKRVMVTGAGGSIGSEICRQVARFKPASILLFENAETALFLIERDLINKFPDISVIPILADIRFKAQVEAVFNEYMPEVVFHAAAYKHVPMMENNPGEAAKNNVCGTRILADIANTIGVKNFVMVSTDKAVNPTNVMGATKRAAELYVQALSKRSQTCFVTVRFGNVLGSNGSVVPIFKEQIAQGGPITVTHPEVSRYFMTIPEASQLVLQAGSMGEGGDIFILDMGKPMKIVHLAEELVRLSGYKPYEDIDIVFTGLRPGEKLFEELLLKGEGIVPTQHRKIMVAKATTVDVVLLNRQIEDLYRLSINLDVDGVVSKLKDIVPEYKPLEHR